MTPSFKKIHNEFKLNGYHYDHEALTEVSYSLIKEGLPFEQSIGDFLLDWLNDKEYLRVKTSGSTGTPKYIYIHKQHMVNSAIATAEFFSLSPGDKALHCLPAKYIAGKMMLIRAMTTGLRLDLVRPSSSPINQLRKKYYDFGAMIPLQLNNSIGDLKYIKKLIVGGAPVSQSLKKRLQEVNSYVFETYGMTESVSHIAVKQLNKFKNAQTNRQDFFTTLPGVSLSVDQEQKLIIKAPHVSEDIIYTNDVVELISKTNFRWLGRADNILNSGGIKIIPEQIEKKLSRFINDRFIVCGYPDEALGQKLVLLVESENMDTDSLLQTIKESNILDKNETPKKVFLFPKFKETETGKVQRQKTQEAYFNGKLEA